MVDMFILWVYITARLIMPCKIKIKSDNVGLEIYPIFQVARLPKNIKKLFMSLNACV